ncbi:MAG: YnbE family lipoprotein [Chlorobiaceae bacterium]|nr:YnbE family lipoprotein [Chlorobiaceae bacterium]NTW73804.1 YnbE family lipoprotein [Chlorobiaceae bacterium]
MKKTTAYALPAGLLLMASLLATACSPTVRVEAPDKPITINMNIKIDHEIRVKVDRDIDSLVEKRKDIF